MSIYAETLFNAALQAHEAGDLAGAAHLLNFIIGSGWREAEALYFLGFLKLRQNDPVGALRLLTSSAAIKPDDARMLSHMGETLHRLGAHEGAILCFRAAIELWPDFVSAHANIAAALHALDRPEEALEQLRVAEAMAPDNANIVCGIASALHTQGRYGEAMAEFRRAQALQPGHLRARYYESLALLAEGDFLAAWENHETRLQLTIGGNLPRGFAQPIWSGEQDIAEQTILLHAEQGLGDAIQFIRYAPLVAARGAIVLLEVHPRMRSLCAAVPGVAHVFARDGALPAFDLHCPLLSLPRAFRTELATIPAEVPYLRAEPTQCEFWRQRLGEKQRRRIGIAWSGSPSHTNDRARSIPLGLLAPLLSRRDIDFHVLQADVRAPDRPILAELNRVFDHGATLGDFASTAALITQLDLVIGVDTALVHLAGALGVPTWVLLSFTHDWRWLRGRDDSPWYPTARLFHQPARGDWASVIDAVIGELDR